VSVYDVEGKVITINGCIYLDDFGAVGDGTVDDTVAFQNAVNKKGLILCGTGKTYKITDVIRVGENTIIDLNGSTILSTSNHLFFNFLSTDTSFTGYNGNGNICIRNGYIIGGAVSFAHGENILLDNVHFSDALNDHFLEIAGCKNYRIINCSFIGMGNWDTSVLEYINLDHCRYQNFPWMPSGSAFYDNTPNKGIIIFNSKFSLGDNTYAYGYNAIGVHSITGLSNNHEDITVSNCEIFGFTGCGIRLNGMDKVYVNNNRIETVGDGIVIGDVGSCNDITIKNNYVVSSNGQKLVKTANRYTNLTVVGNSTYGTIEDF
jgi:hypothetical protein